MKKQLILILGLMTPSFVFAADLYQVYRQALVSDPTYQQAISQRLATREGVPISLSQLLPNFSASLLPTITRTDASGAAELQRGDNTQKGYTFSLNLTQTVFDFGKLANLGEAKSIAKQADAILNAATQALIVKVAKAYFQVLEDEDNLRYIAATRAAFKEQLDQIEQQYKVGLKTITDFYTAQASYQASVANYIEAQTTLTNDKENLRVITGHLYASLSRLKDDFPLISPHPANIEAWVTTAGKQNWSIKASQYALEAARYNIKEQFAGHLPSLDAAASYAVQHENNSGDPFINVSRGSSQENIKSLGLTLTIPIFAGGLVNAQTRQAQYQYQTAAQQLEQTLRDTINLTRQSYLGVISGISEINADKQTIRSAISSLEGMKAGYTVGTEILYNVLTQQQQVSRALQQYASDRYAFINHLFALKQAAGTLSEQDVVSINSWLTERKNNNELLFNLLSNDGPAIKKPMQINKKHQKSKKNHFAKKKPKHHAKNAHRHVKHRTSHATHQKKVLSQVKSKQREIMKQH